MKGALSAKPVASRSSAGSDCSSTSNNGEGIPAYLGPPANPDLPFFSYGLFQPGELAYKQLDSFVERSEDAICKGSLLLRDGFPILKKGGGSTACGTLLYFGDQLSAYNAIGCFEPRHHYCWERLTLESPAVNANVCLGKMPDKGSVPYEGTRWTGKDDALLTIGYKAVSKSAMEFAREPFKSWQDFEWDRFFQIQMAYLLLWSCIERFSALSCGPWMEPMQRVTELATRYSYLLTKELQRTVLKRRRGHRVFDSRTPESYATLDPDDAKKSLRYYYQVRCNLAHRGKGVWKDGELLRLSLCELAILFRELLSKEGFAPPSTEGLTGYLLPVAAP